MKSSLQALVTEMVERGVLFEDAVAEFEKHFILSVLKRTKGNLSKAADELHIHRNTLSKRVEKYYQSGHMIGARHSRSRGSGARDRVSMLDNRGAEFDDLLARMQTSKARKGMKAAFDASPTELGRAAVEAAGKRRKTLLERNLRTSKTDALLPKRLQTSVGSRKG